MSDFLEIMQQRGFVHQCSDWEGLKAKLNQGVQSAYNGTDCTGDSLHVGHLVQIMTLRWFQKCGHRPIVLMGGATTRIGDPSGKDEARKMLDDAAIAANMQGMKQAFAKYITFGDGATDAKMVDNADWLSDLNYLDFLRDYGAQFSVNRMLSFDSVRLRLEREQPLSFLEFNYMILQAYDFLELYRREGTILQTGGSDQWGNIVSGTDLIRRKAGAEAYALTTPLLTTASGAKMGKTAQGAVWLNADKLSPYDFWQYWRNTEDADVGRFLKLFTELPMDEIARLEALKGVEINEAKKILAHEVTRLCHGEDAAKEAQATAEATFEGGGTGSSLPVFEVPHAGLQAGVPLIDALKAVGFAKSNGEARRLIEGGGVRLNDIRVEDENRMIGAADMDTEGQAKLSAGKKRHALVRAA